MAAISDSNEFFVRSANLVEFVSFPRKMLQNVFSRYRICRYRRERALQSLIHYTFTLPGSLLASPVRGQNEW